MTENDKEVYQKGVALLEEWEDVNYCEHDFSDWEITKIQLKEHIRMMKVYFDDYCMIMAWGKLE